MIDRIVVLTIFPTTMAIPLMGWMNPPTFVVTDAQIDLIVQAGLLQARSKRV